MKTLIIYESIHHGNTRKVAEVMSEVLGAEVKRPVEVYPVKLDEYDLIGFGSGLYNGNLHQNLLGLARDMPFLNKAAFIFSTSGAPWGQSKKHKQLKDLLTAKGLRILGDFNCKGLNTHGPERLLGGLNKGKPDAADLGKARQFATELLAECQS
ncbi:MAG TPA: flavodoxin family protein [Methanocella sp.]|nr:flavodoxin family protein [Methanocella sp.]